MLHTSCVHYAGLFSIGLANAAIYASQLCHCGIDACTGVVYSPFSVIAISGFISRLITIPLTIYGDKCLSRLARALPELYDAHNDFDYVNKHPRAISWEKRVAAEKLSSERDRIWAEYKTNNTKTILPYWVGWGLLEGLCHSCGATLHSFYTYLHHLNVYSPLSFALVCHSANSSSTASEVAHLASALTSSDVCVNASGTGITYFVNSWSALWDVLVHVKLSSLSFISSHGLMEQCAANTSTILSSSSILTSASVSQLCIVLGVMDPTLCLAASLTMWSTLIHLRSRVGFNARMDRFVQLLRKWAWRGWAMCVASSVCYAPCVSCLQMLLNNLSYVASAATPSLFISSSLSSSSPSTGAAAATATLIQGSAEASSAFTGLVWLGNGLFPSYVVAFWAGAAVCMLLKQCLINSNRLGRTMCGIKPYPSTHGQYGNTTTNDGLLVLWDQGQEAMEERRAQWAKQCVAYEYECDLRIHRLLRQCGLFTQEEDVILELERVKEQRQRLSERKAAEHNATQDTSKEHVSTQHTNATLNNDNNSEFQQENTETSSKLHRPRRAWEVEDANSNSINKPMSANVGNFHVNTNVEELEEIIEEQRAIQERKEAVFLQPTNEYEEHYKALKRANKERIDKARSEQKEEKESFYDLQQL